MSKIFQAVPSWYLFDDHSSTAETDVWFNPLNRHCMYFSSAHRDRPFVPQLAHTLPNAPIGDQGLGGVSGVAAAAADGAAAPNDNAGEKAMLPSENIVHSTIGDDELRDGIFRNGD